MMLNIQLLVRINRQLDIYPLTPSVDINIESGAGGTYFVLDTKTGDFDYSAARLACDLVGYIIIELDVITVFETDFEVEGIRAGRGRRTGSAVIFVREARDAEGVDVGFTTVVFQITVVEND